MDPARRKAHGTLGWDLLLACALTFSGLIFLVLIIDQVWFLLDGAPLWGVEPPVDQWVAVLLVLFVLGVIPFVWVWATREGGLWGAVLYLGLTRPWPAVVHGMGYAALMGGVVVWVILGLQAVVTPSAAASWVLLTWGSAVAISLVAAFSEEILFRGILQKWLGVWGQAVLFALVHLHIAVATFVLALVVGLLFGFLVHRGRSLWLVIVAHGAYNMLVFSLVIFGMI